MCDKHKAFFFIEKDEPTLFLLVVKIYNKNIKDANNGAGHRLMRKPKKGRRIKTILFHDLFMFHYSPSNLIVLRSNAEPPAPIAFAPTSGLSFNC